MPTAQKDQFGVTEIDSDADRAADHIGASACVIFGSISHSA
jgi:hypothetical protein